MKSQQLVRPRQVLIKTKKNQYCSRHQCSRSLGVNSYSAGIDFRRQLLTSEVDSRAVRVSKIFIMAVDDLKQVFK